MKIFKPATTEATWAATASISAHEQCNYENAGKWYERN